MIQLLFTSFVFLMLSACATSKDMSKVSINYSKPLILKSQNDSWNLLVGKWYGSYPTNVGDTRREIIEHNSQGTYKVIFRTYKNDGSFKEKIEHGEWGVSGPVYFSIYRGYDKGGKFSLVNPSDPYNYDAYKIIELTSEKFEYESFDTKDHYITKRVPADFDFPK